MGIDISIDSEFEKMHTIFAKLSGTAMVVAARQGMNKAITSTRSNTSKAIRKKIAIKQKDLYGKHMSVHRASGGNINTLEARIEFSKERMSAITFATNKDVPEKKGLTPDKWRRVRLRIRPGRSFKSERLFIAKGKSANVHVFRRRGDKLIKQTTPSAATIFEKPQIVMNIKQYAGKRFSLEFHRALVLQMRKLRRR